MPNDLRSSFSQSREHEKYSWVLGFDAILVAGITWYHTDSVTWAICAFVGLAAALMVPYLSGAFVVGASIAWGAAAWTIIAALSSNKSTVLAVTGVVLLLALGMHFMAREHLRDIVASPSGGRRNRIKIDPPYDD